MKKKLNNAFLLISISLIAIVVFQLYWSVSAYRVNKSRFNADIDLAMQHAMDDCKKDYFDSLRRVIVTRLTTPLTTIQIDTDHTDKDTVNAMLTFQLFKGVAPRDTVVLTTALYIIENTPATQKMAEAYYDPKKTNHTPGPNYNALNIIKPGIQVFLQKFGHPVPGLGSGRFQMKKSDFNSYRAKIDHPATVAEVLTEASFYRSPVMQEIQMHFYKQEMPVFNKNPNEKPLITKNKYYDVPPDYRKADSLKITRYLKKELQILDADAPFRLKISTESTPASPVTSGYSETSEYNYRYHAWRLFNIVTTKEFFIRAVFEHTQYTVIKRMIFTLLLSVLLILLTALCFAYVIRIILQQKKLADLKDDFINNMTHELKTPIATITVAIEGLQTFNALNDPEKTQRYLQTSRNELNRLNTLVTQVLNIATFEHKETELIKTQIDIDGLMSEVIASERSKTGKGLSISYTNKDHVKYIDADPLHFRNMISNLLDNAVKYSGEPAEVIITCTQNGGNICFSVKDKGIGIAAANISQVFDKFYRVPTGNVHNVKGTGIGLSYVKYIAEAHGGTVTVKSEINKGSEFMVCIPLSNG